MKLTELKKMIQQEYMESLKENEIKKTSKMDESWKTKVQSYAKLDMVSGFDKIEDDTVYFTKEEPAKKFEKITKSFYPEWKVTRKGTNVTIKENVNEATLNETTVKDFEKWLDTAVKQNPKEIRRAVEKMAGSVFGDTLPNNLHHRDVTLKHIKSVINKVNKEMKRDADYGTEVMNAFLQWTGLKSAEKLMNESLKEKTNEATLNEAFTRQHYNAIAGILKKAKDKDDIIESMADYFANDNPNFNKAMFIKASK